MGVSSLWQLLEPVGRRVNIETLTNKRLAIDASIWLVQFIKAMRDERGEVLRNAHLLGFFRRICRLLFHRVRPVFVFDGGTPALKKRTTAARRRQRDRQQAKLRKAAERLLVSRLKQAAIGEAQAAAASDAPRPQKTRRGAQASAGLSEGTAADSAEAVAGPSSSKGGAGATRAKPQGRGKAAQGKGKSPIDPEEVAADVKGPPRDPSREAADELLAAQLQADWEEEDKKLGLAGQASPYSEKGPSFLGKTAAAVEPHWEEGEDTQLQEVLQRSLARADEHGGAVPEAEADGNSRGNGGVGGGSRAKTRKEGWQEVVVLTSEGEDENHQLPVLKGRGLPRAQRFLGTQDSDNDNFINQLDIPADVTELDPAVLSTLPPSVQYEIMQKLREEQFNQNRIKFQAVAADAAAFSQTQLSAYLKASAFRRKLDIIRDSQQSESRKVANEAGREYIYHCDPVVAAAALGGGSAAAPPMPRGKGKEDAPAEQGQGAGPSLAGPAAGECFEITLDVPTTVDREVFMRLGEEEALVGAGLEPDANDDDNLEWEDVGDTSPAAVAATKKPETWKARMHQRQRFWSRTHGFQLGRKLGDWTAAERREAETIVIEEEEDKEPVGEELFVETTRGVDSLEEGKDGGLEGAIRSSIENGLAPRGRASEAPEGPDNCGDSAGEDSGNSFEWEDAAGDADGEEHGMEGGAAAAQGAQSFDALPSPQPIAGTAAAPGKMEAPGPHATGSQAGGPGAQGPGPARHEDASPAEVSTSRPTPPKASSPEPKEDFHRENDSALTRGTDGLQTRSRDASSSRLPSDARGREDGMPHQPLTAPGGEGEDDAGGRVSWSRMPDSATEKPQALDATPARGTLEKAAEVPTLVDGGGEETRDPDESGLGALLEEPPAGGSSETGGPSDDEAGDDRNLTEDLPDLDEIMEELRAEEADAQEQQRRHARNADTPTAEMYSECQELLTMFGLPYIIAPMEAEAQCAWLNKEGLVDGVVTDDNDAFLFGAKEVFRNIFDSKKYVEHYRASDMEAELGLTQDRLVALALLLGSDYTEGVSGIGIVNATEVVMAFLPADEGQPLGRGQGWEAFKEWVVSPDVELIQGAAKEQGRRRAQCSSGATQGGDEIEPGELSEFKERHRNMRKNWELPDNFPNPHVIEAYKKPVVDRSRDRITFGRPDVEMLRRFCSDQFGWARAKADELLNPVAKAFDERETQRRMEEFFGYSQRFAKIQSVRLQRAVRGISKQANPEIELQPDEVATSSASEAQRRKRKAAAPSEGAERRPTGPAAPQPPPEGKRKRRPESKQAAASRGGKRTKQDQQAEEDSEPTNVEGGGTASAPHAAGVRGKGRGGRAKGMAGGGGGHPHPISSGRPRRGDEAAEKPGAAPAVHLPARKEQQQTPLAALSPPGRRGDCGMPADLALGSSEGPAAQTPPRPPVVLPPAPRRSRAATAAGGATQDAPQPSGTTSHAARPLQHEAAAPSRPAVVLPPAPRRRNTRGA